MACAVLAVTCVAKHGQAGAPAAGKSLFRATSGAAAVLGPAARQTLERLAARPEIRSITLVTTSAGGLGEEAPGALMIEIPGLVVHLKGRIESQSEHGITWVGTGTDDDERAVLSEGPDGIRGLVQSHGVWVEIHPLDPPIHALMFLEGEVAVKDLPPVRPFPMLKEKRVAVPPPGLLRRTAVVRVLVAFTANATDTSNWSRSSIDLANTACDDSDADLRFELAAAVPVPLVEKDLSDCSTLSADLELLAAGTTPAAREVHDYRDVYAADLVVLATRHPSCAGQALTIDADAESAFAIVSTAKGSHLLTLAHELGHLLGGRHVTDIDDPDSLAHGFCVKPKPLQGSFGFGTIMAVGGECPAVIDGITLDPPRIRRWSNPHALYEGTHTGVAGFSDLAHVLPRTGRWAQDFRSEGTVVVSPAGLNLATGAVGLIEVKVLHEGSPARHVPVLANAGPGDVCLAQTWSLTDEQGVVRLPVVGAGAGTASVEVRAAGALAVVPVAVQ